MKSKSWLVLFLVSGSIALWFSGKALQDLWTYFRVGPSVAAKVVGWGVQEISSSEFGIEAAYEYQVNERTYSAKTVFKQPVYLNSYSAEKDLYKWEEQTWRAWYDPKSPSFSTLQKLFPFKTCIQAGVTLGILFYFAFVNVFFKRKENAQ